MGHYHIPDSLMLQTVKDETVILDPDSGNYFTLDAIGSRMLRLYRETTDVETTALQIASEYEVTPDTAQRDLTQLLDQMVDCGLAQVQGG